VDGDLLDLAPGSARAASTSETRTRARLRALRRALAQSQELSARRIAALEAELAELRAQALEGQPPTFEDDLPLRSAYRSVQGLDEFAPLAEVKRRVLHQIFLQNLRFLGRASLDE